MSQEANEISKKELLEVTGISYGQLYRWKRKGLIPEEWFVKKAAFTGQETFFPRTEILERVERIQGLKDDVNLDQLADLLSPRLSLDQVPAAALLERNLLSKAALELLTGTLAPGDPLSFEAILHGRMAGTLLDTGDINQEEGAMILRTLSGSPGKGQMLFLRKQGVGLCLVAQGEVVLDPETRLVCRMDLHAQVAELKLALKGGIA